MIITLIGYRGSGKSSVAEPLAARLGWDWADADPLIEARAGCTIREIFATSGEPRFRELEREVLADLLSRDRLVIAAGGGAILAAETRRLMRAAGPVIWLQASIKLLQARIESDETTAARRPQLTSGSVTAEIAGVLAAREPLYADAASLIIRTDGLDIPAIVREIMLSFDSQHSPGA